RLSRGGCRSRDGLRLLRPPRRRDPPRSLVPRRGAVMAQRAVAVRRRTILRRVPAFAGDPRSAVRGVCADRRRPGRRIADRLGRLPVAAAFPALAYLAALRSRTGYPRALAWVVAGGLPFAAIYVGYDPLRWGTPLDDGYARLTEGDVFFNHGLFSPLYLPRQLYAIFLEPPDLVGGTPFFLRPRFIGMSLFLTTPALLWIFAGVRLMRRDAAIAATAAARLLALLPDLFHGTVGFQQFGYRFSIDAQPFLLALVRAQGFPTAGGTYQAWAERLASIGPGRFYEPGYFCDYPPGFLYVLWLLGALFDGEPLRLAVKALSIPADIAIALLVARLL